MSARSFLTPLNLILGLALVAATVAGFVLIPAGTVMPIHWGITGDPDGFLPRDWALFMIPGIAVLVTGLLIAVQRMAGPERAEASRYAMASVVSALLALFATIQVVIVMIGAGAQVEMPRVVVACVGALFAVMGNVLPKTQQNMIAGVRIPWTLASPQNWQATNRLAGLLMMIGGLATVAAALLTGSTPVLVTVLLLAGIVPAVAATMYSHRLARRQ